MKEKFEHKLTNKIREVFENHPVEYNPQDWESLNEKLARNRKSDIIPWRAILKGAAVLLLILSSSYIFWIMFGTETPSAEKKITDTESFSEIETLANDIVNSGNIDEHLGQEPILGTRVHKQVPVIEYPAESTEKYSTSKNNTRSLSYMHQKTAGYFIPEKAYENSYPFISSRIEPSVNTSENVANLWVDANSNDSSESKFGHYPNAYEFSNESYPAGKKQSFELGVEVSSFTNYSPEELAPGVNYSAGLTFNVPIKSKFSFNPGLVLSAYDLVLANGENVLEPTFTTASTLSELITNDKTISPSEINLTGLDLPLNFQYRFFQGKQSGYFVELGFSSLFYLSETYQYDFISSTGGPLPYSSNNASGSASEEINVGSFQTFDFASLINFSLGWDYRLNKQLDLTLNPFLKYPVNTLASNDIKFGSAGIKLKFMLKP